MEMDSKPHVTDHIDCVNGQRSSSFCFIRKDTETSSAFCHYSLVMCIVFAWIGHVVGSVYFWLVGDRCFSDRLWMLEGLKITQHMLYNV